MPLRSVFLLCALSLAAVAQTGTSSINGTVSDPSGAIVPGAAVAAANEETGIVFKQETTGAGIYMFPAVPVGRYAVTVEMKGFRTIRRTGNVLLVNTPLTID
ncbi:MAG: carboxypeptidase-like regulatory domain-containing protein, partial [Bryobacteraceae bacterium]